MEKETVKIILKTSKIIADRTLSALDKNDIAKAHDLMDLLGREIERATECMEAP